MHSCETTIIKRQNKQISDQKCQFSGFRILELVFIPLKDPTQYIVIPETPSELNLLRGSKAQTLKLYSLSVLFSNEDCVIQTLKSILKLLHEDFKESRQNLIAIETSLQAIRSYRRTRTWIETSTDAFTYLRYVALD